MIPFKSYQRFKSKHKHKGTKNLNTQIGKEIKIESLHEEYDYPVGLHEKLAAHYNYTPDHHGALKEYSDDSTDHNNHLWTKHENGDKSPAVKGSSIDVIDKALSSHKTPHAMTVYSGVHYDPSSRGETVHHPAYLSTSLDHEVAKGFSMHKQATEHQKGGKHIMAIHVPEGHAGAYLGHTSHVPQEREFVLPRGLNLKHSHTDTQMGYSRIYRKPQPIHTHHMTIEGHE